MKKLKNRLFLPSLLRLNTMVVWEVVLLLSVSLAVIFYFSRQILRKESMEDAEQTLEATVLQVDNVLLSVEQTAGNIYWDLVAHLDQPERMYTYSRELVKCNPYVTGCAIAFKPNFYPDRELFMAYVYRKSYDSSELITSDMFGNKPYVEQAWYLDAFKARKVSWMYPLKDEEYKSEHIITLCLPIYSGGVRPEVREDSEVVGVVAVDLSIDLLSQIVLSAKSSARSVCLLLNSDGSFIIHPRPEKRGRKVFEQTENDVSPSMREAVEAMLAGETGNCAFQMGDEDYHAFYKPFVRVDVPGRSLDNLKWSIAIAYPENDISAAYRHLIFRVLAIAIGGLLLLFLFCRVVISRQLKPLRKLTRMAQSIADGNFKEQIPDTNRKDEIGQFQEHFKHMQEALATKISEQEQLTATLQQRRETLRKTYEQVQEDNRVKSSFLKNMTNQIIPPSEVIVKSVTTLCNDYQSISLQEANREVAVIRQESDTIVGLLDQMLKTSRKEDNYE